MNPAQRYTRQAVEKKGWVSGSTLENRFALSFSRLGVKPGQLVQQHSVGRFRIDFADPDVLMGIEADGFYHRMPGAAEKDATRDAELLAQGWFVFRITDDLDDEELAEALLAAVLLISEERQNQQLDWVRDPATKRRKPSRPSRLAVALGHRTRKAAA